MNNNTAVKDQKQSNACRIECHTKQTSASSPKPNTMTLTEQRLIRSNAFRLLTQIERVRFNDTLDEIAMVQIPKDQLDDRWYTNSEYFVFKREAVRASRKQKQMKEKNELNDDNRTSFSALGMVDEEALRTRDLLVRSALHVVLKEQEAQCTTSAEVVLSAHQELSAETPPTEVMATKYREISRDAKFRATEAAKENENEAREYCRTTRANLVATGIGSTKSKESPSRSEFLWKFLRRLF
mmetsp:Transcript_29281/g.79256  ORF Transcript_29281/g.79256 Transcript_29281/m.79256 type:complete len:240 (+) Transcript_29281:110-829(+)